MGILAFGQQALENKALAIQEKKVAKEGELNTNEGAQGTNRTSHAAATQSSQQAQTNVTQYQSQIASLEAQRDNVSMIVVEDENGNQTEVEDFTTMANLDREISDLEVELTNAQGQFNSFNAEVNNLNGEYGSLQAQYQVLSGEVGDLQGQYDTTQAEIEQVKQAEAEAKAKEEEEAKAKVAKGAEGEGEPPKEKSELELQMEQQTTHTIKNNSGTDFYAQQQLVAKKALDPSYEGTMDTEREILAKNNGFDYTVDKTGHVTIKNANLKVGSDIVLEGFEEGQLYAGETTKDEAVAKYKEGQEILAKEKAEADAKAQAEAERQKTALEDSFKNELNGVTLPVDVADLSDEEADKLAEQLIGNMSKTISVNAEYGQDIGKLTGGLAKKYGAKNLQKILGRTANFVAKGVAKATPLANAGMAAYGATKIANGDYTGVYDVVDVALSYIPIVGTALSFIGSENMVKGTHKMVMSTIDAHGGDLEAAGWALNNWQK